MLMMLAGLQQDELPPVLEHYAARGLVHRIDGTQPVDQVHAQILKALGKAAPQVR